MIEPTTTVRRSPRAAFRRLDDGSAVVLHLDTAQYHGVNEIGALIWELAETGPTFAELVEAVAARVDDPPGDLEADVEQFVYALKERDLIDLIGTAS